MIVTSTRARELESRRARQFQFVSKAMVPFTSDILKGIVTGD
jgi:hypothetical protein